MGIKLFLNDYYDLLKFMHDNEVVILDEKVIPLTQQEIATTLKCSKMKINSMFSILQKQDYIEQKLSSRLIFLRTPQPISYKKKRLRWDSV